MTLAMSGMALPEGIAGLLETLNLTKFYPDKLSRDDLYEITEQSLRTKSERDCSLSWQFIYSISRYNYQARNVQAQETCNANMSRMGLRERHNRKLLQMETNVHPLDILLAVFLCCEPTARQDLVMHLWGCKLAIPFIVQNVRTGNLHAYRWPLRCLVGQLNDEEVPLIGMSIKTISFIRVGENENLSKSYLLNCFIGGPEKAHPTFFHRDSEGSKKSRSSIVNGLVEIGRFLPKGSPIDKFSSPRLFLNLRGDAKDLMKQVHIIGEISTVTVVVCSIYSLVESENVIRCLLENGSSVVVLLSDKTTDADKIDTFFRQFPASNYPDDVLEVIETEGVRLWDILRSMQYNVDKMEKKNDRTISLTDIPLSDTVSIDETENTYRNAFDWADRIISELSQVDADVRKKHFLPLQETYWKEWSKLDRNLSRFDQLESDEKKKYKSRYAIGVKMKDVRDRQFKQVQNLSLPMEYFVYALVCFNSKCRRLFLRYLKLELDNLSRKHMGPFYKQYHELLVKQEHANEEDRIEMNAKLSRLDIKRTKISLGLEHFIREMGQIYEACQSIRGEAVKLNNVTKKEIFHNQLPQAACVALQEGYPLEILDGEAFSVPMIWVSTILHNLPKVVKISTIKDLRVHIISVLGIQSSGKSTFLNTLFGLQFAVSAGRCTRGAYMQLVKLDSELKDKFKTDYILAIDTEGLKSAELTSNEFFKHDNELSTFVIGLADTTVINLMGENATYLQDNLPIAVHAFLRMNLVGLHPRCIIVHHNVDKRNKEKLLQQSHFLETVLNKYTKKACEIEKCPDKLFREIIEFNISEHTDYIPALLEGERPMAPISTGYSEESDLVRAKLLTFVESSSDLSSLRQFSRHLENLWTAIKRDRFVYEFKTTLETEARIHLDNGYYKILNKYVRDLEDINTEIKNLMDTQKDFKHLKEIYLQFAKEVEKKHTENLKNFFDEPKKVHTNRIESWEREYQKNFEDAVKQNESSDLENIENNYTHIGGCLVSNDQYKKFFSLYSKNKSDLHLINEEALFNKTWEDWKKSLHLVKNNVLSDTVAALHTVCPAHKYLLEESTVRQKSLKSFRPSLGKHTNAPLEISLPENIISKMDDIIKTVISEYDKELKGIWHRQLPYSHRHPLMILLTIEKHLKHRLATEDRSNEIKNSFRIDMLLCTAGSCVHDLEKGNKENQHILRLKTDLRELAKKGEDVINDVSTWLKIILKKAVNRFLTHQTKSILTNSLFKSKWKHVVRTKEDLLGNCLKHIITSRETNLLLQYVNYPASAVSDYLNDILETVVESVVFEAECQLYVTLKVEKMLKLIKDFMASKGERYVTPKDLIQDIVSKIGLHPVDEDLITCRIKNQTKFSEQYILVENQFIELKSLTKQFEYLAGFKSQIKSKDSVLVIANDLCTNLIGCNEQCPFCKELCRYTKKHPGRHECYIHRPVGCAGVHWHETKKLSYETCPQHVDRANMFWHDRSWMSFTDYDKVYPKWKLTTINSLGPSLIWKFIFVKHHSVLRDKFQLPDNLPENWKSIEEHEALRAVDNQFRLETRV